MKNMKNIMKISGLLVLVLPLIGCQVDDLNDDQVLEGDSVTYTVIHSANSKTNGELGSKTFKVLKSQAEYFDELANYSTDATKTIDFDHAQVILLDIGQRNSGGYSVEISDINEFDDYIKVEVNIQSPGNGCITTQALTNPYKFIELQGTKEITINESLVSIDCE
ncbi:MAG: protease complex subunit PrcB family protein [Saccharospirillaceae bacterium]|nr:protease complex subunit PrcB family protein [Pseudomonadales bacterium]NRB79976.1 protease complex subunit PrcB family protein [Saccharospirillaceae bacterium]